MTPILPATLALLMLASAALAQDGAPGSHFVTNWDLDGDGAVSLAEAITRRDDIFTTFDANEDDRLDAEEYLAFDAAREADQAEMPKGKGRGNPAEQGMRLAFNDRDGDGTVSRDEFLGRVPEWFAKMDRDQDGKVTTQDFGQGG